MRKETPNTVNLADYLNIHYSPNKDKDKGQDRVKVRTYKYLREDGTFDYKKRKY